MVRTHHTAFNDIIHIASYIHLILVNCTEGADYDELGPRQQRNRRQQIRGQILNFTRPLMMISLQAINVEMITLSGSLVDVPIEPSETRLIQQMNADDLAEDELIPKIAYLQYKYGISAECYLELTKIIGGPKAYKVSRIKVHSILLTYLYTGGEVQKGN